jgi:hypothetical protein
VLSAFSVLATSFPQALAAGGQFLLDDGPFFIPVRSGKNSVACIQNCFLIEKSET